MASVFIQKGKAKRVNARAALKRSIFNNVILFFIFASLLLVGCAKYNKLITYPIETKFESTLLPIFVMLSSYCGEKNEWPDSTLELRSFVESTPKLSYPEFNWNAMKIEKLDNGRVRIFYEDANLIFTTTLDKLEQNNQARTSSK